jgi:hypothetical protein
MSSKKSIERFPHNRMCPRRYVDPKQIEIDPEFVYDANFQNLYKLLHHGKIRLSLTRLPESIITSGYHNRKPNGTVDHVSNLKLQDVKSGEKMLRSGARPPLDVYWSPHAPGGGGYVCADDEVLLATYRKMGIKLVPCRVLRPKPIQGPEAALWLENNGNVAYLHKAVPPAITSYATFVGQAEFSFSELVGLLTAKCAEVGESVVSFDQESGSPVHYHQMLHAVLRRHERALDSILRLVHLGRIEHAAALTRVAYEAFLNFYLDWLSPEFVGVRLHLLAEIREAQSQDKSAYKDQLTVLGNFPTFMENTSEKARISPLGAMLHEIVYPTLSFVAHQSYMHLREEGSEFLDYEGRDNSRQIAQIGRWLDFITAALVVRVRNEVGAV